MAGVEARALGLRGVRRPGGWRRAWRGGFPARPGPASGWWWGRGGGPGNLMVGGEGGGGGGVRWGGEGGGGGWGGGGGAAGWAGGRPPVVTAGPAQAQPERQARPPVAVGSGTPRAATAVTVSPTTLLVAAGASGS